MICHIFHDCLWRIFSDAGFVLVSIGGAFAIIIFIYVGFRQKPGKLYAMGICFVFWSYETLIVIHRITCVQNMFYSCLYSIFLHPAVEY